MFLLPSFCTVLSQSQRAGTAEDKKDLGLPIVMWWVISTKYPGWNRVKWSTTGTHGTHCFTGLEEKVITSMIHITKQSYEALHDLFLNEKWNKNVLSCIELKLPLHNGT